jgi:hypothetical protein
MWYCGCFSDSTNVFLRIGRLHHAVILPLKVKVQVKVALYQAIKLQRGSKGIALLFL